MISKYSLNSNPILALPLKYESKEVAKLMDYDKKIEREL
jgi:hypothetical protein